MNISIPYTRGKFDTRNYTKSGKIKNELYRKPENGLILDNGESSIDMGRTSLENEMGVLNLKTDVKNTNSKIDRAAERQQKNEKTLITKKTTQNCNLSNLSGVIWIGTNKKIAVLVLQPENIFNNVYTIRAGGSFHYKIPLTENVEFPSDSSSQLYNQSAIERQLEFLPAFQMGMTFKILGSDCRLIRQILLNHGFSELSATSQNQTEFNILWAGNHLRSYTLRNLLSFQRVNHFPKSYELTRKDRLFKNIQRMQHTKGFRNFDFIPVSFIMPNEYADFCSVFTRERGVWIAKPVASSRGRGIYLVAHPDQLNLEEHSIVSKYISNPLLIDGFKFDLRLYLAVTSYDPLVAYLYEEGLSRFATVRFDHSVRFIKNACMHLTNYSINKKNHGYVQNSDADIEDVGNKWTLGALLRHLNSNGVDTKQLISKIEDILVRTLLAVQAPISSATKMFTCHRTNCFELYGVDILIDKNLKPWLLEINLSPSLNCDSPLDLKVKSHMVSDLLTLSGIICIDPGTRRSHCNNRATSATFNTNRKNYGYLYNSFRKNFSPMSQKNKKEKNHTNRDASISSNSSLDINAIPKKPSTKPRNCNSARYIKKSLTADQIRFIRKTKEENERRHAWVRIFPTSTSLDQYGHFIVGKTNDFVLHRNLFGQSNNKYKNADKEKLSPCQNVSPYNNCLIGNRKIYQYYENITKRKLSFSNNVNVLNSSSIYNRTLATFDKEAYMEMCNEHHGQYIRQLKWGSRRSKPYNIKMERYADKNEGEEIQMKFKKKLNIDTSVVENKTKCMTSHKTKFIENKDSLLKKTVKPLKVYTSETIQKYSIALSHVHARNAFAAYLLRIKENIQTINNCDLEKSGNLQMGLIEKFLNKVSDCDLNWKNKNLQFKEKNLSEKPMLIEKLSAYIKKYVQDTTMMNKNAKTFPKSKETFLEIDTFIREASEQDLEYLLTNYTKNLNCVNLFLSNENLIKPEKSNIKREKVNQEFVKINYQNAKIKSNKALNDSEKKFQSIKFPKKQEKSKIDLKYESKNSNKSKDRIDIITVNSPPTKSNFEAMHNLIRKNQTRYYTNKSKQKISLTFRENHKNYELGNFKQPITSLNDNVINERIKSKLNYLGISSHDTIKNYKTSFPLDFKFNLNLTNHSIKNTFKDFDNKITSSLNHCTPDIKNRQKIFLMERLKQSSRLLAESRNKHDQFINNKLKCENNDKSKQPKSSMKLTNLV